MPKPVNTEEIIASNPLVDATALAEALKAISELRKEGIDTADYEIVSPFSRKACPPEANPKTDETLPLARCRR